MQRMSYQVYDLDLNHIAFDEEIFKTKEEAVERILDFFLPDWEEEIEDVRKTLWKTNSFNNMEIREAEE